MIAFLINELDVRGGTHKQLLKLLDYAEQEKEPFFIVTKRIDLAKTYPGFSQYANRIRLMPEKSIGYNPIHWFRQMSILKHLVKDAHCINIHDNGFEAYLPVLKGKKIIWQVNDLPWVFNVGVHKKNIVIGIKIKKIFVKQYLLYCKRYITEFCVNVSKNRDRIYTCFHRDAHVFYCGIESVGITRKMAFSLERFHKKEIHILSSGVFFPYRNYETLIAVVNKLRRQSINATLKIIGSTAIDVKYVEKIKSLINRYNLENYITICGQVDEDEFRRLHSDADIFAFINIDQSWGLAVFEAMSCQLPVFVSKSVGATEILQDGENAIFVDPNDSNFIVGKIISIMNDDTEYLRLCQTAGEFCSLYSWNKSYCSKMLSLIRSYPVK